MAKKNSNNVICSDCNDSFVKKSMFTVEKNGYRTWCCDKCIKTFSFELIIESPKTK
jgi:ribosomal protein L37AE/L43A